MLSHPNPNNHKSGSVHDEVDFVKSISNAVIDQIDTSIVRCAHDRRWLTLFTDAQVVTLLQSTGASILMCREWV